MEVHPFSPFVPKNCRYLILGSFPGRIESRYGDWFYETKKGQFWSIIQEIYKIKLRKRKDKEKLFENLGIAIYDVISKCERAKGNNADNNLARCVYSVETVGKILDENEIVKIYFSSRFVEKIFKSKFRELLKKYSKIELVTLPSSSPRYAKLSLGKKAGIYKKLLPKQRS